MSRYPNGTEVSWLNENTNTIHTGIITKQPSESILGYYVAEERDGSTTFLGYDDIQPRDVLEAILRERLERLRPRQQPQFAPFRPISQPLSEDSAHMAQAIRQLERDARIAQLMTQGVDIDEARATAYDAFPSPRPSPQPSPQPSLSRESREDTRSRMIAQIMNVTKVDFERAERMVDSILPYSPPLPNPIQPRSDVTIDSIIPGTRYTYNQLGSACTAYIPEGVKVGSQSVHDSKIINEPLANDILSSAFGGMKHSRSNMREEFLACLRDPPDEVWRSISLDYKRGMVDQVCGCINDDRNYGSVIEKFELVYNFMKNFESRFQDRKMFKFYIPAFIRQVIEIQPGVTLSTWRPGSNISCVRGIRERMFPELRLAISGAFDGQHIQLSDEESRIASIGQRRPRLNTWLREYLISNEGRESIDGFKEYCKRKIQVLESDNNESEWDQIITDYTNSEGIQQMFGGKKKYKKTYRKKQNKRKSRRKMKMSKKK